MSNTKVPEGMMTVDAYAKIMGITTVDAINRVNDGELEGKFIGGNWYIDNPGYMGPSTQSESQQSATSKPADVTNRKQVQADHTQYGVARVLCALMTIFGCILCAIGFIGFALGIITLFTDDFSAFWVLALPSLSVVLGGLFTVAMSQLIKATIDNADNTRAILMLMRNQS